MKKISVTLFLNFVLLSSAILVSAETPGDKSAANPAAPSQNAASPAAPKPAAPAATAPAAVTPAQTAPAAAAAPAQPAKKSEVLQKMVLCQTVQDREPVNEVGASVSGVEILHCWTKVNPETVPSSIKHIWYANGKKIFEISLPIKIKPSRTWSNKTVFPGQWKVEVVDESGAVLGSKEVTVTSESAPAQTPPATKQP